MERVIVTYVNFYAPGAFIANTWTKEVESEDPYQVEWPDNAYAFDVCQRVDLHDGPEVFQGKVKQIGPTYYHPDSTIKTLAEVEADPTRGPALLGNMRTNGWDRVIYTRWGTWPQPFNEKTCRVL